jgi:hypothetical protein
MCVFRRENLDGYFPLQRGLDSLVYFRDTTLTDFGNDSIVADFGRLRF